MRLQNPPSLLCDETEFITGKIQFAYAVMPYRLVESYLDKRLIINIYRGSLRMTTLQFCQSYEYYEKDDPKQRDDQT